MEEALDLSFDRLLMIMMMKHKKNSTLLLFIKIKLHKIDTSQTYIESKFYPHFHFHIVLKQYISFNTSTKYTRALIVDDEDTRAKIVSQYHL